MGKIMHYHIVEEDLCFKDWTRVDSIAVDELFRIKQSEDSQEENRMPTLLYSI